MKILILLKKGSTFFKLAEFFIIVNIVFLFIEIRTVTRSKADELNSTFFVLAAMLSSFMGLGMMYFAKFYKIKEVEKVQKDLLGTRLNHPKPLDNESASPSPNLH